MRFATALYFIVLSLIAKHNRFCGKLDFLFYCDVHERHLMFALTGT